MADTHFSAKALRAERARVGIGRSELARRSGVSRSTIRDLEQEKAQVPTSNTVYQLAKALGCSTDVLFREPASPEETATP